MIKVADILNGRKNYIDVYHANFSTTHNLVTITRFTAEQFYDYFDTYVRARTPNCWDGKRNDTFPFLGGRTFMKRIYLICCIMVFLLGGCRNRSSPQQLSPIR